MKKSGFTLIELSIVLVIIGLIVGGVLVGRDLIAAAEVRAFIAQVEKYQTAVNAFKAKYNALPGDIAEPDASAFGFYPRGAYIGDGNGLLMGESSPTSGLNCIDCQQGETAMFWRDLSTANLIDAAMNTAVSTGLPFANINFSTTPNIRDLMPQSRLGQANYFQTVTNGGRNYYVVSGVTLLGAAAHVVGTPGFSVIQTYNVDQKVDDGLPQTGRITAQYLNSNTYMWVGATGTAPTTASATTCYDNGAATGVAQAYSVGQNGGNGLNCALSIRF